MTTIKTLFIDTIKIATENLNRGDYEKTKNNLITALNIMTAITEDGEDGEQIKKLKNALFNMKMNLTIDQQTKMIQDTYLKVIMIAKDIGLIDVSKKDIF